VIIFANGACAQEGLKFRALLGEVASYGAMAIANGPVFIEQPTITTVTVTATTPTTTSATAAITSLALNTPALLEVLDWLDANAGKGDYKNVDGSRVAVWGQSCGGLEAYSIAEDPRVSHVGIFDSGQLTNETSAQIAGNITKPIFYFLGGPTDVAYPNVSPLPPSLPNLVQGQQTFIFVNGPVLPQVSIRMGKSQRKEEDR
jgi:dienelactone hydrolase